MNTPYFAGENVLYVSAKVVANIIEAYIHEAIIPEVNVWSSGSVDVKYKFDLDEHPAVKEAVKDLVPQKCYVLECEINRAGSGATIKFTSDLGLYNKHIESKTANEKPSLSADN